MKKKYVIIIVIFFLLFSVNASRPDLGFVLMDDTFCETEDCVINNNLTVNGDILIRDKILSIRDQELNASFLPTEDNKFDIGSAGNRWKDAYFSGTLTADSIAGGVWNESGTNIYPSDITASVGIGTASPGSLLSIDSDTSSPASMIELNGGDTRRMILTPSVTPFFGGRIGMSTSNSLALITDNLNRIYIESDGDVGIGTTNPLTKLEVNGTLRSYDTDSDSIVESKSAGSIAYVIADAATGNSAVFELQEGNSRKWIIYNDYSDDTLLFQNTDADVRLAIEDDGNVGIGYAHPRGALEIQTDGTGRGVETDDQLMITSGDFNEMELKIGVNNATDYSYIQSSLDGTGGKALSLNPLGGNVGIGTTSPAAKLHVVGGNIILNNTRAYKIDDTAGTAVNALALTSGNNLQINAPQIGGSIQLTSSAGQIHFITTDRKMTIQADGKVGIGTTSPDALLNLDLNDSSAYDPTALNVNTDYNEIYLENRDASANAVGIVFALRTNSNAFIGAANPSNNAADLVFATRNDDAGDKTVEHLRITSGGNVGIGTTTPNYKLEVDGIIDADNVFTPKYLSIHTDVNMSLTQNEWRNVTFPDSTEIHKGIDHQPVGTLNTTVNITASGIYLIEYFGTFIDTAAQGGSEIAVRVTANGTEIVGSLIEETSQKQGAEFEISDGFLANLTAPSSLHVEVISDATTVSLKNTDIFGEHPSTMIFDVIKIDKQ